MNIEFNKIEDTWLCVIHSRLIECIWMVEGTEIYHEYSIMLSQFDTELKNRKLDKLSIYDNISDFRGTFGRREQPTDLPTELLDKNLTDIEVRILYMLGAEIADFSCLGRGVRKYVESIWLHFEKELKYRKIEPEFFCDLELEKS